MAIGLSNVETRKVKKPSTQKAESSKPDSARPTAKSRMATIATAQAAPLKERKERSSSSGELNSLWLEWSNRVAGVESESLALFVARQWMELERLVFDLVTENVLKELRKTAFGAKVVNTVANSIAQKAK